MRYGQPVEACGTRLDPEAPGSYRIIYSEEALNRLEDRVECFLRIVEVSPPVKTAAGLGTNHLRGWLITGMQRRAIISASPKSI